MAQIRHSIPIEASLERIFPLVATARGFSQWWAADVTEKEGIVDLGFFKRSTIYRLQLTRSAEPRLADWVCLSGHEWAQTHLVFELVRGDTNTVVRFTHADWKAETDYFISCTTTWGELMFRLKAVAEGKKPGPLFSADGMAY